MRTRAIMRTRPGWGETEAAAGDCDPEWRGEQGGGGAEARPDVKEVGGPAGGPLRL